LLRERTIERRSGLTREHFAPAHYVPANLDTMPGTKTKVRTLSFFRDFQKRIIKTYAGKTALDKA